MQRLEKGDYYMENGLMVFTAQFHRRRGFCCGNGCRHCPYGKPEPCPPAALEHPLRGMTAFAGEAGPANS
jgi:hypothetical protein